MRQVAGFVSCTLVDLGDDEVSGVGVFESAAAADEADATARSWTADRLGPLVAGPLEVRAGEVLVSATA